MGKSVYTVHRASDGQDIPGGVVVKLKEWDGEELHILGHGENLCNNGMSQTQTSEPSQNRIKLQEYSSTYFSQASAQGTISCILSAW